MGRHCGTSFTICRVIYRPTLFSLRSCWLLASSVTKLSSTQPYSCSIGMDGWYTLSAITSSFLSPFLILCAAAPTAGLPSFQFVVTGLVLDSRWLHAGLLLSMRQLMMVSRYITLSSLFFLFWLSVLFVLFPFFLFRHLCLSVSCIWFVCSSVAFGQLVKVTLHVNTRDFMQGGNNSDATTKGGRVCAQV